ncbi:MAG: hypothetical protein AMXMBFR67_21800 [Nitrospira sp.]
MVQTLSPILTALQLPASLCRQWRQGLPIILTVGTAMLEQVVVPEWWSPTFYLIPLGLSFRNRDRRIALACATLVSGTPLLDFWGSAAEQDTTLNTHHAGVVLAAWVLALGTPSRRRDRPPHPIEPRLDESGTDCPATDVESPRGRQLEQELQLARERLRALSHQLIDIQEAERRELAHNLHDEFGQILTALKMDLNGIRKKLAGAPTDPLSPALAPRVHSAIRLTEQAIDTCRKTAMGLRPSLLDDLGLVAAIRWLAYDLEERSEIVCEVEAEPESETWLFDERIAIGLYRIVQELLTNVARHAHASHVRVKIVRSQDAVTLRVEDNGVGIPDDSVQKGRGFGLRGLQERTALLNGSLIVRAEAGGGTLAMVRIPLPATAQTAPCTTGTNRKLSV